MKYERLTDEKIAEMLINTEGDSWDSDNIRGAMLYSTCRTRK